MMIFSLVAIIGLEKCCIKSAYLQWLYHSGERAVARGPVVFLFFFCVCFFFLPNFVCTFYIFSERERERTELFVKLHLHSLINFIFHFQMLIKVKKDCLCNQRTHKITKIGDSV